MVVAGLAGYRFCLCFVRFCLLLFVLLMGVFDLLRFVQGCETLPTGSGGPCGLPGVIFGGVRDPPDWWWRALRATGSFCFCFLYIHI